jgi:hypothetical protein
MLIKLINQQPFIKKIKDENLCCTNKAHQR